MSKTESKIKDQQITREEFNLLKTKVDSLTGSFKTEVPKKPRAPSDYNKFMASKYPEIQKQNPTLPASDIFKMVAALWKESKK